MDVGLGTCIAYTLCTVWTALIKPSTYHINYIQIYGLIGPLLDRVSQLITTIEAVHLLSDLHCLWCKSQPSMPFAYLRHIPESTPALSNEMDYKMWQDAAASLSWGLLWELRCPLKLLQSLGGTSILVLPCCDLRIWATKHKVTKYLGEWYGDLHAENHSASCTCSFLIFGQRYDIISKFTLNGVPAKDEPRSARATL